MCLRRGVAGESFRVQLVAATGIPWTTTNPSVRVCPIGQATYSGTGTLTHEGDGCWTYSPPLREYDYSAEAVQFQFVMPGMVPVLETVGIVQTIYQPPKWDGGETISKARFMELIAMETWNDNDDRFIQALTAGVDPIPLGPAVVQRLRTIFPSRFN